MDTLRARIRAGDQEAFGELFDAHACSAAAAGDGGSLRPWLLRFELRLPHAVVRVWAAVATPEGMPTWLAAADVLEPRIGGAAVRGRAGRAAGDGLVGLDARAVARVARGVRQPAVIASS
ncbi:hypothetical protein OHT93_21850 [Streptomyces sp. NBC_00191]|uniref:hypothetical protein n=1 Tax=Streptomyces sp. NBC_00191 TaxID=2975674 RepID=UPI0032556878